MFWYTKFACPLIDITETYVNIHLETIIVQLINAMYSTLWVVEFYSSCMNAYHYR